MGLFKKMVGFIKSFFKPIFKKKWVAKKPNNPFFRKRYAQVKITKIVKNRTNKDIIRTQKKCLNCEHPFHKASDNFCNQCGQKRNGNIMSIGDFAKEFLSGLISWDSRFWRTLWDLISKPGKVAKNYTSGQRIKYTNPFRIYFTISIITFMIQQVSLTLESLHPNQQGSVLINDGDRNFDAEIFGKMSNIITKPFGLDDDIPKMIAHIKKNPNKTKQELIETVFGIAPPNKNLLDDLRKKHPDKSESALKKMLIEKQMNTNTKTHSYRELIWSAMVYEQSKKIVELEKEGLNFAKIFNNYLSFYPFLMFLVLPIIALFFKLLYIRRKIPYTKHLIFVFLMETVLYIALLTKVRHFFIWLDKDYKYVPLFIGIIAFLIYGYKAFLVHYEQGYLKTALKFLIANLFIFALGVTILFFSVLLAPFVV